MHGISVIASASWVIGCGNYDHDFLSYTRCTENWLCFISLVAFFIIAYPLVQVNSVGPLTAVAGCGFKSSRIVSTVGLERIMSIRSYPINSQYCSTRSCSLLICLQTSSQLREIVTRLCNFSPVNDVGILMLPTEQE